MAQNAAYPARGNEAPYSVGTAYLLLIPSFFIVAGLQRFYLGKVGTGILYLITGGLFGLGTLYDLITLPRQVEEANYRRGYRYAVEQRPATEAIADMLDRIGGASGGRKRPMTLEHAALTAAKNNGGHVTPTELALAAEVSVDDAKKILEDFVSKGIAEVRAKKNGVIAYVFPEFFTEAAASEFEDL